MTATNHVLTGAAIGLLVSNPAVALPMAFVSHFVLDVLPHYGNDGSRFLRKVVLSDAILVLVSVLAVLALVESVSLGLVLWCMFLAYLPDMIWIPYYVKHGPHFGIEIEKNKVTRFLHRIQWGERPWLWPVEVAYALAAALFLGVVILA